MGMRMMSAPFLSKALIFLILLVVVIPTLTRAECTCDPENEEDRNKGEALKYKGAAIASILTAGAIGVCLPIVGKTVPALRPEKDVFFIIKAFAAGVILATGFIHVLPDAFENLTSPCLKGKAWEFPFTGLVAMMSAIVTLMIDAFATTYFTNANAKAVNGGADEDDGKEDGVEGGGGVHVHTHATHGHAHGSAPGMLASHQGSKSTDLIRHRVISQVILHLKIFSF